MRSVLYMYVLYDPYIIDPYIPKQDDILNNVSAKENALSNI